MSDHISDRYVFTERYTEQMPPPGCIVCGAPVEFPDFTLCCVDCDNKHYILNAVPDAVRS